MGRSTLEVGGAQPRSVTEITPKSPLLCVLGKQKPYPGMVFVPTEKSSGIV